MISTSMLPAYVLITPARNEVQYIELTLRSMVAQTLRPLRWVIVSDGSVDGTDEVVRKYAIDHPWIELIRMPERHERDFAGKVRAFNAGRARVASLNYEVIGNLDADVSFGEGHFNNLVSKFAQHPKLGVVGAPFREGSYQYDYRFTNIENVWGGCQLFLKECFDDIGGYVAIPGGSIDHIAVVSARMKGWKTRTFTESVCLHHRTMGTAQTGGLRARFKHGAKDYAVGNHPLWEMFRTVYQMRQPPYGIGGVAMASGYCWSMLRRVKRPVPETFVAFTRHEQMQRLSAFLGSKIMRRARKTSLSLNS
jgi:poly-beta-1,6-N-acetyl-D-glucosamine synthase